MKKLLSLCQSSFSGTRLRSFFVIFQHCCTFLYLAVIVVVLVLSASSHANHFVPLPSPTSFLLFFCSVQPMMGLIMKDIINLLKVI